MILTSGNVWLTFCCKGRLSSDEARLNVGTRSSSSSSAQSLCGRPQALELKLIDIGVSIGIRRHRLASIVVVTK
jgi:hypothetical protein